MYASANDFVEAVDLLLAQGSISVNFTSKRKGWSALCLAAQNGHLAVAQSLVEQGANVNQTDGQGFSPLYKAALNGHVELARLLIDHGSYAADFTQEILLLAEAKGHHDVVKLLVEEGAAKNTAPWMGLQSQASVRESRNARESEQKLVEMQALAAKEEAEAEAGREWALPQRSSLGSSTSRDSGEISNNGSEVALSASALYR
jgi:hypothetical protein